MIKSKLLLIFFLSFLVVSCRKENNNKTYTITGTILESSSNPVPVSNYKLQVDQRDDYGLFGGVSGISAEFATGPNGSFSLSYTPEKSTGLVRGGDNTYPLAITGIDTINYKGLYPYWYPITPNKDTALNTIYLYKKIQKFVRKIQFDSLIGSNDSLEVITFNAYRSNYKTLHGPIAAGTFLVLDTIQLKIERHYFTEGGYFISTSLKKEFYQKDFSTVTPPGDEDYREQSLIYP